MIGGENVGKGGVYVVHLVDEDHVGDVAGIKEMKERGEHDGAVGFRLHHHHGDVGDAERALGLLGKLHRTGTVHKGPLVIEIGGRCGGQFRAHLAGAGLRRTVAHRIAVLYRALAVNSFGN